MTWRAALADPIYRRYVIIILSLLAAGGLVLAVVSLGLRKNISKVWTIWRS